MTQKAPFPTELAELVEALEYRPGWTFELAHEDRGQGSEGLTLKIGALVPDTYHDRNIGIMHYMLVPPAAFDKRSWQRWLLDQVLLVERHEACEFFKVGGERPYAPHHGPGNDPYIVFDHGTDEDARTSFLGVTKPE